MVNEGCDSNVRGEVKLQKGKKLEEGKKKTGEAVTVGRRNRRS